MPDETIILGAVTDNTPPEEVHAYIDKLKNACLQLSQENEKEKSERWGDDKVTEGHLEKARLTHELDCKKADCEAELRKKTLIQAAVNKLLKDIAEANTKADEITKLLEEAHARYDKTTAEETYYSKGAEGCDVVERIAAGKDIVAKTRLCLRDVIENHDRVLHEKGLNPRDRSRNLSMTEQESIAAILNDTSTYSSVLCGYCKHALRSLICSASRDPLHTESITEYWHPTHHNPERKSNTTLSPYVLTDEPHYSL
eukprot:TRINITY_DN16188_c0_g1_i1.p1 TRINITY_DN16188_c0_g1~~TRINITY_DN16188_c0_g1_i1.p1  ORF type:complete len:256 (+),score=37.79 TRINITY_DN16188_c0_g1_i1:145-912(+)